MSATEVLTELARRRLSTPELRLFLWLLVFSQSRNRRYSALELAKALDLNLRTARAALQQLSEQGLVSVEGRRRAPTFRAVLDPVLWKP